MMSIIPSISFCNILYILLGILSILLLRLLQIFIIKPYLLSKFYSKQGGLSRFKVGAGSGASYASDALENGDFFLFYKKIIKSNPNLPFICDNIGPLTQVLLIQPDLVKEFISLQEKYYVKGEFLKGILSELLDQGCLYRKRKMEKT